MRAKERKQINIKLHCQINPNQFNKSEETGVGSVRFSFHLMHDALLEIKTEHFFAAIRGWEDHFGSLITLYSYLVRKFNKLEGSALWS